jgi:guanine deaminase
MTALSQVKSSSKSRHLFLGTFIHCKSLDKLEILYNAAVLVDENGIILKIAKDCSREDAENSILPEFGWKTGDVAVLEATEGQFYFPGFIGM